MRDSLRTYSVRLHGSFRLTAPDGSNVPVTSRKGVALLALLCSGSGFERRRAWIVDQLWGSRAPAQGLSSLRQELHALKRILNARDKLLHSTRDRAWLDAGLIQIETVEPGQNSDFLEGIDIRGEEGFEDWLRQQRQSDDFASLEQSSAPVLPLPSDTQVETALSSLTIEIAGATFDNVQVASNIARSILRDRILEGLHEFGGVRLVSSTHSKSASADLLLIVHCHRVAHIMQATVEVRRNTDGKIMLVVSRRLSAESRRVDEMIDGIEVFAGECTERLLSQFAHDSGGFMQDRQIAARSALQGVHHLFSRTSDAADQADAQFAKAIEIEPNSAFYAWRAYLSALRLEETSPSEHDTIRERAVEYCRRSYELDTHNGLSLALLTHVHGFVLRDFSKAHEFLARALEIRPNNVMTQDAAALLRFYMGDLKGARSAAFRAERMGQYLPYRFCFATTQSMIETMSGNFRSGIIQGERAGALMPPGKIRPYPPTLRYLGICYAQVGEMAKAEKTFALLDQLENGLNSREIDSRTYPVPSTAAAQLLRQSLRKVGK